MLSRSRAEIQSYNDAMAGFGQMRAYRGGHHSCEHRSGVGVSLDVGVAELISAHDFSHF
jgi:hypothetical protein